MKIVCCIGSQPAAEVTAIRSWAQSIGRGPSDVLLIDTRQTKEEGVGARVRDYLASLGFFKDTQISLECSLARRHAVNDLWAIYKKWMQKTEESQAPLMFCVQPGFAYLNTQFFLRLPDSATLLANSLTDVIFGNFDRGFDTAELVDIGFEETVRLYDRQFKLLNDNKVRVSGNGVAVDLDLHWEYRGRLFGAIVAEKDWKDTHPVRQLAREVAALSPLNITITLVSRKPNHREYWEWLGMPSVANIGELSKQTINQYPHNHTVLTYAEDARGHGCPETYARMRGGGGDGDPMVCWMNEDPLATLLAIYTHRPKSLYIAFDATHPRIQLNVSRLIRESQRLPVDVMHLLPSDAMGSNLKDSLKGTLDTGASLGGLVANVSPGSKLQGLALATLVSEGATLFSLVNKMKRAESLTDPGSCLAYSAPPIELAAAIRGGPLDHPGRELSSSQDEHKLMLCGLAIFLAYRADYKLSKKGPLPEDYGTRLGRWRMQVTPNNDPGKTVRKITITRRDPMLEQTFVWTGGDWFEALTAYALAQDPDIELRTGLCWSWVAKDSSFSKAEADIVVEKNGTFFVVECKTGMGQIDGGRRQARTVAAACFGRFAIPVVVVPWIKKRERNKYFSDGVPVISLSDLSSPESVSSTLERLRESRKIFKT